MSMHQQKTRYANIQFTPSHLMEMDGSRPLVIIDVPEIQQITLRYGIQAPHPVIQSLFGGLMICGGLVFVAIILGWLTHGGTLHAELVAGVAAVPLGIWMMSTALRKGFFLEVQTKRERKRLSFERQTQEGLVKHCIDEMETALGITVIRDAV